MSGEAIRRVLERLESVRPATGGFMARCPAHEDRLPSLKVSEGAAGRVLLHCHAGCELEAVLAAAGLTKADLFESTDDWTLRRETARHPYHDRDGAHLFDVLRFNTEPKCLPFLPGAERPGIERTARPLYRLPALLAAVAAGETVYVAEGEKDADALVKAGVVATTNPFGAGPEKWRPEHTAALAGAHVVIVQDRDEPGRRRGQHLLAVLTGVAASVRLDEPAVGKDAHDHLQAGRSVDELVSLEWVEPSGLAWQRLSQVAMRSAMSDNAPSQESAAASPFVGRTHAEVLDLTFEDEPPDLIENLVPAGVVVTTAGLPETYKGWIASKKATIIASGTGELFGCPVVRQGPVGYFWQDDSTRNEAERVQLAHRVHGTPRDLPIRWFLNESLSLPDDLGRLRDTIEQHGLVYVVLDSWYNVARVDLRDTEAGALVARIKSEICDTTGCTIDLIDHMPWPTLSNRGRLRGYGDVFKNAAIRAGLYIDAEHSKLWVEARGNNIRGFKRTPAYWDEDRLELRLVDTTQAEESFDAVSARVLDWLTAHPGNHSTSAIRRAITGRDSTIDAALATLKERGLARDGNKLGGTWTGEPGAPRYWQASAHIAPDLLTENEGTPARPSGRGLNPGPDNGPRSDDTAVKPALTSPTTPAHENGPRSAEVPASPQERQPRPAPFRGPGYERAEVTDDDNTTDEKTTEAHPISPHGDSSTASHHDARPDEPAPFKVECLSCGDKFMSDEPGASSVRCGACVVLGEAHREAIAAGHMTEGEARELRLAHRLLARVA